MDKFLFVCVMLGLLVWWLLGPRPPKPASPATAPAAATTSAAAPAPAAPSGVSAAGGKSVVQLEIEGVCRARGVELLEYRESPDHIVELRLRARDRNALSGVLDDIGPDMMGTGGSGLMKDLFNDAMRYEQHMTQSGEIFHLAYYKIRAFR